mgnify:CR=1 FL=1
MEALVRMVNLFKDSVLFSFSVSLIYTFITSNLVGIILMDSSIMFLYFSTKGKIMLSIITSLITVSFLFISFKFLFALFSISMITFIIWSDRNENIKGQD